MSKVNKCGSGCWLWVASVGGSGYGQFYFDYCKYSAHRVAFVIFHRKEIPEGLCVLHTCDTPRCVNPSHLFLGTNQDNMVDKVQKNRQLKGEAIPQSKLNTKNVKEIRKLLADGYTHKQISSLFAVCRTTITHIASGYRWRHVV